MYRIDPSGTVLHQFSLSIINYPVGVAENEAAHQLYTSDRRTSPYSQQIIYVTDTLGSMQGAITHPLQGPYGTRCLALDGRTPTHPPSLLNTWAWYNASGGLVDSCGMYELDRVGDTVLNGYVFPNKAWDLRGIEYDPRDGSYWVTIMHGGSTNNMIVKVAGFNYGKVGVEEPSPRLPGAAGRLEVQARPNPFTGNTNLSVSLPAAGNVDVRVYYNNGRLARTLAGDLTVGTRAVFPWDGRDERGQAVAPGIYFYRVQSAAAQAWGKIVLSR
jgi:hypothetical protein